jgi:hypothetical protein
MMTDPATDRITLQSAMTQDDYARYSAVMRRRQSSLTSTALYAGTFFMAVPTALVLRSIGQHLASEPSDADLIGKSSLFAFMLGVLALVLAGAIARRLALRNYVKGALNALGSKTVILDATRVTVIGQVSQSSWRWAAISQLILERGLILILIGGRNAFAIPDRSFESSAARDAAIAFIRARLAETRSGSPPAA